MRTVCAVFLALLALAGGSRADLVFFEDGFVIEGRVRRESVTEWDPVGRDLLIIPKGFFMLDDGPRRTYFAPTRARIVEQQEMPSEERIIRKSKALFLPGRRKMPGIEEIVDPGTWDARWDRKFTYRSGPYRIAVPQHLSLLTPSFAVIDATAKYPWRCYYLTPELGPKMVRSLIESHPEFQMDDKKLDATQKMARRLRAGDFYAQAGWFDLAEEQLELLLEEQPKEKERVAKIRKTLERMRTREAFEQLKRLHNAGQHEAVRVRMKTFPREYASDETLADLKELQARYDHIAELLKEAERFLEELGGKVSGPHAKTLAAAAKAIRGELHFTNVERLDAFLGQARQAERWAKQGKKPDFDAAELLSLAVTGWLLNSPSAEANPEVAVGLWRARDLVFSYLKARDSNARLNLLRAYQKELREGGPTFDEIVHMIPLLPPVEPAEVVPARTVRRTVDSDRFGKLAYHLRLPPEYSAHRRYPVLVVLSHAGQRPTDMLARWQEQAAENGYVLAAPEWEEGISRDYHYSEREHETVLSTLRDLRKHFQVDSDRVFLFGLGDGGRMAFDVGLAYPDLFAGVATMGAAPNYFPLLCWRNGQYLPFYVVQGTRVGGADKAVRMQFENWLGRHYPMLWVEYKGRGMEWCGGEVPHIFDWMRNKVRAFPLKQLGTDGFGGAMGNEFCVMRQGKHRFYWISVEEIDSRRTNTVSRWNNSVRAATLHARVDARTNTIHLKTIGVGKVTLWLGHNRFGESPIDLSRPVTVRRGLSQFWRTGVIRPSLATLLEDLYQRGDRQRLFWHKIELDLRR
jgi:pimeloyl-ACP methyl ester carboxylesterase